MSTPEKSQVGLQFRIRLTFGHASEYLTNKSDVRTKRKIVRGGWFQQGGTSVNESAFQLIQQSCAWGGVVAAIGQAASLGQHLS